MTLLRSALIDRHALRAADSCGSYSPYTQYFELDHPDISEWLGRQNIAAASRSPVTDVESIIHHELSHWIQAHGTSVNAMLSAFRSAQLKAFMESPGFLGKEAIEGLFARRFGPGKRTMMRIGATGLGQDPLAESFPDWRAWRERWWHLQLAQRIFESPGAVLPVKQNLAHALRESLSSLGQRQPALGSAKTPHDAEDDATLRRLLRTDTDLTILLEGFASANQLIYYGLAKKVEDSPWLHDRIDSTIRSIAETAYGKAIRQFVARSPDAKADIARGMLIVCAIIDLALNPPLDELIGIVRDGGPLTPALIAVFPANRFEKLCEAATGMSSIRLDADDETIRAFQYELLERARLSRATDFAVTPERVKSMGDLQYDKQTQGTLSLGDAEAFWQRCAFAVREEHPSLFVLPSAQYLYGRAWLRPGRDEKLAATVQPPLWSDKQHHIYFGLTHAASHCLIFWSIVASIAHDIIWGRGRIDLSMYPEEVVHSGIADNAMKSVFHHFGFEAGGA